MNGIERNEAKVLLLSIYMTKLNAFHLTHYEYIHTVYTNTHTVTVCINNQVLLIVISYFIEMIVWTFDHLANVNEAIG